MRHSLRGKLTKRFLNNIAPLDAISDADKGETFQRRNVILNELSLKCYPGEGKGAETLSASR